MSKIYNEYLKLKEKEPNKLFLFHNGKFYIFIADDVDTINNYVVLKPTKFTSEVNKCGFPESRFEDYMRVFNNHKLNIQVIELKDIIETSNSIVSIPKKYIDLENKIKNIDINNITPIGALNLIIELKELINE